MGEHDPVDDVGFFERTAQSTDRNDAIEWAPTRRQALRGGLTAGVVVLGAAGLRTSGRSPTNSPLSPVEWASRASPPAATRRHVSAVGPVASHEPRFGSGSSWEAYEYIDTELYHYGSLALGEVDDSEWLYLFNVRSVAVQSREDGDESVELFERARPSHELTVELHNAGDIEVNKAGLIAPKQLEESLSELSSETTDGVQPGFPAAFHKTANIEDRIDEAAKPGTNRHENHWPLDSLSGPQPEDSNRPAVQAVDETSRQDGVDGADDISSSFSLGGRFEQGAVVGSAATFAVRVDSPMEQAPWLSVTARYGSSPRERRQEWTVGLESLPPLRETEEYAFGRDDLERWPLFSHRQLGRNGIDERAVDHQTTFPFGDVVAEDDGWTTPPVARPDPKIERTSGTAASQPPGSPLTLSLANRGEWWDAVWVLFGSGLASGYEYVDYSPVTLESAKLQPGHVHVGAQVDDTYRLSGLGELTITIADATLTGTTSISDRSVTLRAEVAHPEPTAATEYRAKFQYAAESETEYQTGPTVDSSGTGRSMLATLTDLEPDTQYSCKVTLEELVVDGYGKVKQATTLAESEPLTVLTNG